MAKNSKSKDGNLTFQQSINRISEIVTIMEDGKCELEDMVSLYQEGAHLIELSNAKLQSAKLKIAQINKSNTTKNKQQERPEE